MRGRDAVPAALAPQPITSAHVDRGHDVHAVLHQARVSSAHGCLRDPGSIAEGRTADGVVGIELPGICHGRTARAAGCTRTTGPAIAGAAGTAGSAVADPTDAAVGRIRRRRGGRCAGGIAAVARSCTAVGGAAVAGRTAGAAVARAAAGTAVGRRCTTRSTGRIRRLRRAGARGAAPRGIAAAVTAGPTGRGVGSAGTACPARAGTAGRGCRRRVGVRAARTA